MRMRRLGSAGPELSTVGFGAWAIGGPWRFGWGEVDDDDSIAAIRRAVELPVVGVGRFKDPLQAERALAEGDRDG